MSKSVGAFLCLAFDHQEWSGRCNFNILFYGDPHGCYQNLFNAVDEYSPEAVIVLGDFMLTVPLEQQVAPILDKTEFWYIHGNHDTDNEQHYRCLFESELAHRNLHGRVVTIAGIRVAGLGGVFRGKIWHPGINKGRPLWTSRKDFMRFEPSAQRKEAKGKYGGLSRQHHSSIWWPDYESLYEKQADILVTHEAPSSHRHGFEVLDDLAFAMNVGHVFHGHHHVNYQARIEKYGKTLQVHGVANAECKDEKGNQL